MSQQFFQISVKPLFGSVDFLFNAKIWLKLSNPTKSSKINKMTSKYKKVIPEESSEDEGSELAESLIETTRKLQNWYEIENFSTEEDAFERVAAKGYTLKTTNPPNITTGRKVINKHVKCNLKI